MTQRQSQQLAGIIFVVVPVLINIPYSLLIADFHYPDILRQPPAEILLKFHEGGTGLILTWWAFGFIGIPLIYSLTVLHRILRREDTPYLVTGTVCGIIALIAQFVGLLRWTFVVPFLADTYALPTSSQAARDAAIVTFQAVHQYGGVVLGEHIGQLFTIIWMLLVSGAMLKSTDFKPWLGWMGILGACIYLLEQLELFATVIPQLPVLSVAGLIGSLMWLIWMMVIGVGILRMRAGAQQASN
jgi:hypothetical protein